MNAMRICLLGVVVIPAWLWAAGDEPWQSDNPDVVCDAIHGLQHENSEEARTILLALLDHMHPAVREEAAYTFHQTPWTNALPKLMVLAAHDPHAGVRACAVMALGESREPRCLPLLRAALTNSSIRVRDRAGMALGQFDDIESVEPLLNALRDDNTDIVSNAIRVLGRRKGENIVRALLPFLERPERKIRVAAAHSIGRITGSRRLASDPLLAAQEGGTVLRQRLEFTLNTNRIPPAAVNQVETQTQ